MIVAFCRIRLLQTLQMKSVVTTFFIPVELAADSPVILGYAAIIILALHTVAIMAAEDIFTPLLVRMDVLIVLLLLTIRWPMPPVAVK